MRWRKKEKGKEEGIEKEGEKKGEERKKIGRQWENDRKK